MNAEAVVEGVTRRHRSIAEKRRIVEETLVAGASVAAVARSHSMNANQLFGWRKLYRTGRLGASAQLGVESSVALLPVRVAEENRRCEASSSTSFEALPQQAAESGTGTIHLQMGEVQLRLEGRVDEATLRVVLESLRR